MHSERKEILEALEIEVYGIVQGVMFRQKVKDFADSIGLKGYAMNRPDGSVLIVAQGEKSLLNELLVWLRMNPGFAQVKGLAYKNKEIDKELKEFSILKEQGFVSDKLRSFKNLGKAILGKTSGKIPLHVAIIPDGNRRWAKEKGLDATMGHKVAGEVAHLKSLMQEAKNLGVKYISFWGFSTENWSRSQTETSAIFKMIEESAPELETYFKENNIKFKHLGRKDRLPRSLVSALIKLEKITENNSAFGVQLCLDYGGRDEILRAVNKIIEFGAQRVDENSFKSFLDTKDIPDPDLIIRTSGEQRTSGLMPFQAVYSELYFSEVYFPDFDEKELRKAIVSFGNRTRRFGGNSK